MAYIEGLRQEDDHEFKVSLGYIMRLSEKVEGLEAPTYGLRYS